MKKTLLRILAVSLACFAPPSAAYQQEQGMCPIRLEERLMDELFSKTSSTEGYSLTSRASLMDIKHMLNQEAPTLQTAVINKVITTLECSDDYRSDYNTVLTVVDFSLPSNEKRLWVFDLIEKKLLFHTYVSHGINSGALWSDYFSNKNDSKASSIGVYRTEKSYRGRHGLSLQLEGLDAGDNDNASRRAIVMHGGWYVEESFIKKYGRAGRSWGCPAVPTHLTEPIINTIKDDSLFVAYYPDDHWLLKSKFLHCGQLPVVQQCENPAMANRFPKDNITPREDILFADINNNNQREENEPVVTITADNYVRFFETNAPLDRMLRRQIDQMEYIVLSQKELDRLLPNKELSTMSFVIPVVQMERGYYATEMKKLPLGKITTVSTTPNLQKPKELASYTVHFEEKPDVHLKSTHRFIRWLGL